VVSDGSVIGYINEGVLTLLWLPLGMIDQAADDAKIIPALLALLGRAFVIADVAHVFISLVIVLVV